MEPFPVPVVKPLVHQLTLVNQLLPTNPYSATKAEPNVRSYLYCEDVAENFEVILHKGEVGHVYNIGTKKERRVIDVAEQICILFSMDPEKNIKFVENKPFNDQRYFLDDH
jgi:dTDP-D-glucose 4,6-dehydratase